MSDAIRRRGIHLDFKGAPLPIGVLLDEMARMASWGINLLVFEYEDAFPYSFDTTIQAPTAYSPADITRVIDTCKSLGVEVVPLVQTFGHLDFVLKHPHYSHLAQTEGSFASIDPTLPEGRQIVLAMIDNILDAHPDIRWLHLGGDEVDDLGQGHRSKARADQIGNDGLYLEHMMPILDHVIARGVRPILWDDMMRRWPMASLQALASKTDLMPWSYTEDTFGCFPANTFETFRQAGIRLWAAAAFKGADGIIVDLPDDRVRMINMAAWARCTIENEWEGMIATGWSRYNSLVSYCELWQSAPMCLYLAAQVMKKGHFEPGDWDAACKETIGVTGLPRNWSSMNPKSALEAVAPATPNSTFKELLAIAAVAQWRLQVKRRFCEHGILAMGHFEDPSRYTALGITHTRHVAEKFLAAWPLIQKEFTEALSPGLYPQDLKDYLASRYRIGLHHLQIALDAT